MKYLRCQTIPHSRYKYIDILYTYIYILWELEENTSKLIEHLLYEKINNNNNNNCGEMINLESNFILNSERYHLIYLGRNSILIRIYPCKSRRILDSFRQVNLCVCMWRARGGGPTYIRSNLKRKEKTPSTSKFWLFMYLYNGIIYKINKL